MATERADVLVLGLGPGLAAARSPDKTALRRGWIAYPEDWTT